MEVLYVTARDDPQGKYALGLLAKMGLATRLLTRGEVAPPEAVALFTPTGPVTVAVTKPAADPKKPNRHQKPGERGGFYLCCSGVVLEPVTPAWAQSTPLRVGIKATADRRCPDHPSRGTFAQALAVMAQMFRDWNFAAASLVPWQRTDKDPNFRSSAVTRQRVLAWRERFNQSRIAQAAVEGLEVCAGVKQRLRRQGGYYVFSPAHSLQISPDLFGIAEEDAVLIKEHGPAVWEFWEEAEELYYRAAGGSPKETNWLTASIEGPISLKQREWQRRIALNQRGVLPLFARVDLSSFWFINEIQERIGGLGLVESWAQAIRAVLGTTGLLGDPDGLAHAFAVTVKAATGKEQPVVALISPPGYLAEQRFFAKRLKVFGVEAYVIRKEQMGVELCSRNGFVCLGRKGPWVDLLYRREINAASMAKSAIGRAIMEAVLNGRLLVEPPLNMIFDCKTPLAWVHHPETRENFRPAVRRLITPTALLPKHPNADFVLDGERLTLNGLIGRPFVVKYGGENLKYGLGGRAVYHTGDNSEGIERGLAETAAGHPWVVQRRDQTRYFAREWDEPHQRLNQVMGAGRIMLHYARNPGNGRIQLELAAANLRPNHWKAAGNKDAIFQEVRLKGGA